MMYKKISLILSMLVILFGTNVFAHSHLEESFPKKGEMVTEPLKEITLTYETNIEQASTFTLKDANGNPIPVSSIAVEGNKLVGKLDDKLANGSYTINWKIIGADGHILEGEIPFSIQLADDQTVEDPQEEVVPSEDEKKEDEGKNTKATDNPDTNEKTEESTFNNYIIPVSIGVLLIIIGIASYWLFKRRKQV